MVQKKNSRKQREKQIKKLMGTTSKRSHERSSSSDLVPHGRHRKRTGDRGHDIRHHARGEFTVEGTFSYSGRGFGFCVPDSDYEIDDVFISPRETMGAMTGDRVKVSVRERFVRGEKKYEGAVISVEHAAESIIGTLHIGRGYAYVIPDMKRYNVVIYVPAEDAEISGALDNYKVEVVPSGEQRFTRSRSITVRGKGDMPYFDTMGRISTVFGSALERDANYSAILFESGIRTEFPDAVLRDAERASSEKITADGRVDLRGKVIFTIDGAGAKDLDDAISLEKTESGYRLGVHIADVSHYVREGSPTAAEALLRGTSVYFIDRVVPMLPEALSNGACSLGAGTDKYALSAEITLDRDGNRTGTRIFKSIINSTVRGVYSEVNDIFEHGEDSEFADKYSAVGGILADMHELYEILSKNSAERGMLELEDSEAVIIVDENGAPVDIVPRERGDAEKLIEQFMLQANMGVAEVLKSRALPCLYRIHESPDPEKIRSFAIFIHNLGLDTRGISIENDSGEDIPADALTEKLREILREAEERGIFGIVSSVLLRSMMKAKYQAVCAPHFGLGAPVYCHFTSPIRRYPDLFVHTVISAVLEKSGLRELTATSPVSGELLPQLSSVSAKRGESSTECEIRATEAERSIEDLYMALYMRDKVGCEFHATVCSVIRSGMFVECDNLVEGFVPAACFKTPKINEQFMTLEAEGEIYTLGSSINVTLTDVDLSAGKITFAPTVSTRL